MNRKEFEDALMSTIVEYISDQVILRYAQACKKATVLFSGALIGYKDAVTSLNELKKGRLDIDSSTVKGSRRSNYRRTYQK